MTIAKLNRCSFLSRAYTYIKSNPGCCKADVVRCDRSNLPARTLSYRYGAINALLGSNSLVTNAGVPGGKYVLFAK